MKVSDISKKKRAHPLLRHAEESKREVEDAPILWRLLLQIGINTAEELRRGLWRLTLGEMPMLCLNCFEKEN